MSLRTPEPTCDSPPVLSSPTGAFILPETDDGDTFTLFSMNIRNRGYETEYPANRMACLSKIAAKADIATLQEDFQTGPKPDGYSHQRPGRLNAPGRLFLANTSGLTLLSRIAPDKVNFTPFGTCNGWLPDRGKGDCWPGKGVQSAQIGSRRVFNLHADAGRTNMDIGTRFEQFMDMQIPLEGDLLISGDSNLSWASEADERTLKAFTQKNNLTVYYRGASNKGKDMILGRGYELVDVRIVPKKGLSDHDGVIARFKTATPPAPPRG